MIKVLGQAPYEESEDRSRVPPGGAFIAKVTSLTRDEESVTFKHISIPTDGSELSNLALADGATFAKETNAKITSFTITAPFHSVSVDAVQVSSPADDYSTNAKQFAVRNLRVLSYTASKAGVPFEVIHRVNEHPYEEIVNTAHDFGCDLISQASHGRRGIGALVLGSETHKVLTHSKIPVLVYR